MQKITFKMEILTPLLMHGADPNQKAELRAASIRGVMRYWFRAALGEVIGDQDLSGLAKLEGLVFGDTKSGGPISLQVIDDGVEDDMYPILPHKTESAKRSGLKKGGLFRIIMSSPNAVDPLIFQAAIDSLIMATSLGGFGQRSRRGYGTLGISSIKKSSTYDYHFPIVNSPSNIESMHSQIVDDLTKLAQQSGINCKGRPFEIPKFPCFSSKTSIWVGTGEKEDAMSLIRDFMQKIRDIPELGGINPRQSSPLWVKPLSVSTKKYALLMTFIPSKTCCNNDRNIKNAHAELEKFEKRLIPIEGWNS